MNELPLKTLFYDNPRLLILFLALILVGGASSFYVLPRMEDPELTERFALVVTALPGATANRVESLVTEKLEEELQEIDEIKEVRSMSRVGVSTLVIELRDDIYAVDHVWSRIRDKLEDARLQLPVDATKPDIDVITTKSYSLIAAIVWDKPEPPADALLRRTAKRLKDQLRLVPGTQEVDLFGEPEEEIVVEVDQEQMAFRGMTINELADQIGASDAKVSAGKLHSNRRDLVYELDSELDSIQRVGHIPIRFGGQGQFVRLDDIATVQKGIRTPRGSEAIVSGQPAVMVGALVLSNQRLDHWNARAEEIVRQFSAELPDGLRLHVVFEQSKYVEARLQSLLWNLLAGAAAVIGVILLMMGWRSALVVGSALPLAALMVLAGMRFLEIPIHQMSVAGLIIALGLLIDNAIVTVDEIRLGLAEGKTPRQAVSHTISHLAIPLLGSTLTTAFAFAPIALMPGPAGEFVGAIALSVILAIFSSLLLAMTVTPTLAALIAHLETRTANKPTWWQSGVQSAWVTARFRRFVSAMIVRPWLAIPVAVALPIFGFFKAAELPEQFFPAADRDQLNIELELPSIASLDRTKAIALAIREIAMKDPMVSDVHWLLGETIPSYYYNIVRRRQGSPNYGQAIVELTTEKGGAELIHRLQAKLDRSFPEARVLVRQLEQGPPFDAPVEVRVFGPDLERLAELGDQVREILSGLPHVTHTRSELTDIQPKLAVSIDEETVRLVGIDNQRVARQLFGHLEGYVGGSILEQTEQLPVRVRVSDEYRGDAEKVRSLNLRPGDDPSAMPVPLHAVANFSLQPQVATISRLDGRRMSEVQTFITAGTLPAVVQQAFLREWNQSDVQIPPGYGIEFGGEAAKRDDAVNNLISSVAILMVLMVATLVLSFRSFRLAGLIGLVGGMSVGLGLLALWLFGFPFGFMAIVGTMGLVGVAINDSIVVLAAIRENNPARRGDPEAVVDVVMRCSRHVLSTSLTTIAGFLPLVLAGGGFWPPLAIAISGGVLGATLLALLLVPTGYLLIAREAGQVEPESQAVLP